MLTRKKISVKKNITTLPNLIDAKLTINTHEGQQQLVEYLMKENSEFKQLMIDQNKQLLELAKNSVGHHNTTANVINNNTNNNFNLQFFLNETCKDAMNIMEFVDQLQVSVKDLEETGRLGYAEGISKIFINGLHLFTFQTPNIAPEYSIQSVNVKNTKSSGKIQSLN